MDFCSNLQNLDLPELHLLNVRMVLVLIKHLIDVDISFLDIPPVGKFLRSVNFLSARIELPLGFRWGNIIAFKMFLIGANQDLMRNFLDVGRRNMKIQNCMKLEQISCKKLKFVQKNCSPFFSRFNADFFIGGGDDGDTVPSVWNTAETIIQTGNIPWETAWGQFEFELGDQNWVCVSPIVTNNVDRLAMTAIAQSAGAVHGHNGEHVISCVNNLTKSVVMIIVSHKIRAKPHPIRSGCFIVQKAILRIERVDQGGVPFAVLLEIDKMIIAVSCALTWDFNAGDKFYLVHGIWDIVNQESVTGGNAYKKMIAIVWSLSPFNGVQSGSRTTEETDG